jgi:hypothetical protein
MIWGLVVIALGLLAWIGQTVSWLAPATAARLSLADAEGSVDDVFWADSRGEALWDALTLWTLPLAGLLLLVGLEGWAWFGLAGGGMYLYFGGRGILTRLELRRRGHHIGEPSTVRLGLTALAAWGLAGLITIAAAVVELA